MILFIINMFLYYVLIVFIGPSLFLVGLGASTFDWRNFNFFEIIIFDFLKISWSKDRFFISNNFYHIYFVSNFNI